MDRCGAATQPVKLFECLVDDVEVEVDSEVAIEVNDSATNASTTELTATNITLADELVNESATNASTTELTATNITSADDPMMSTNSVETVCEMNPEFFTTGSLACEFIDRVVVETLAFFLCQIADFFCLPRSVCIYVGVDRWTQSLVFYMMLDTRMP